MRQLFADARVDALTGLANRRSFGERADVEVARADRHGSELALVLFDIDHFKQVNDRSGHDAGDRVLVQVAGVLRSHARAIDVVARLGGEEFVAVLPECDAEAGREFAERARAAVAALDTRDAPPVTLSAGVAAAARPSSSRRSWPRPTPRSTGPRMRGATGRSSVRAPPVWVVLPPRIAGNRTAVCP